MSRSGGKVSLLCVLPRLGWTILDDISGPVLTLAVADVDRRQGKNQHIHQRVALGSVAVKRSELRRVLLISLLRPLRYATHTPIFYWIENPNAVLRQGLSEVLLEFL